MQKLLIVDIQKQFNNKTGKYEKIVNAIKEISPKYDAVYATVFSQTVANICNPNWQENLKWYRCLQCSSVDLEFDVAEENIILKNGYGISDIHKYFNQGDEIDIIGCYTDACILAICFQLWDLGCNFRILEDYVYASAQFTDETIKTLILNNFGDCMK